MHSKFHHYEQQFFHSQSPSLSLRDIDEVRALDFPVFARGITPIGPLHRGPGEINFPVSCGGIVVNPADLICADDNGAVVIRRECAATVLKRLRSQAASISDYEANVRQGVFNNDWVDNILEQSGCATSDRAAPPAVSLVTDA